MSRLLVVDDDPDQLELRKQLLEHAGYEVSTALNPARAIERFQADNPQLILTDLRLPKTADGLALIRRLRELSSTVRIVVLSGLISDLEDAPEAQLIDRCVSKPVFTEDLLRMIRQLTLWFICVFIGTPLPAREFKFNVAQRAEMVAEIELASPGSDWSNPARQAAVAAVTVEGAPVQHIVVYGGPERRVYRVFLGEMGAGDRRVSIDRDPEHSAYASQLEVISANFAPASIEALHAPVLFARANTIGRFSDVPLVMYCEKLVQDGRPLLQYTVVFSNEDGGTSTRALMARWGRTTDIEYIYRVYPDGGRAIIQGRDHRDLEFTGPYENRHPLLMPVTDNNMVAGEGPSALRFQFAPIVVDLNGHSREQVLDDDPVMYRVASQELEREAKLREFGSVDGEKISDPRNYLYLEAKIDNRGSRLAALVQLQGEDRWRASHLGLPGFSIERSGWVRTTVELPPGTRAEQIARIGFECLAAEKSPAGTCRVDAVSKAFMVGSDWRPDSPFWKMTQPRTFPTGEIVTWSLESK